MRVAGTAAICGFVVDDPEASDGKAARMPGGHNEYAVQFTVDAEFAGTWHCHVMARSATKEKTSAAFTMGIFGPGQDGELARKVATAERAGEGKYATYDLGTHELKPGSWLWVRAPGDGELVEAVYVDRMFLIREIKKN